MTTPAIEKKSLWRALGPTLITASVVIGPGSITVASRSGASYGYSLLWLVVLAGVFMATFSALAARVGMVNSESLLDLVARYYGRILAALIGVLAFVVTASFQVSNYIACSTALTTMTGVGEGVWVGVVGVLGLIPILGARNLFEVLEKTMRGVVLLMIGCFLLNLSLARPDFAAAAGGLIPRVWPEGAGALAVPMVATTFSVIAAFYQASLARQKGWRAEDLSLMVREVAVGIGVLVGITLVILTTSAAVLRGVPVGSAADLAEQLRPLLGATAVWIFSAGFLAAGLSSVVINPMIGGGLMADGLGRGDGVNGRNTRIFTVAGMGTAMVFAWITLARGTPIEGILLAQRTTILAVPLCAIVLGFAAIDRRFTGGRSTPLAVRAVVALACLVVLGLSAYRVMEIFASP